MKNLTKKILAVVLTLCILMSGMITAYATGEGSGDYAVLVDNSAGAGYDAFWLTSLGLEKQNLPSGEKYIIQFDLYSENIGTSNSGSIRVWEGHMSGGNAIQENDSIWFDFPAETGEWVTISKEVTATSVIGAVYIYAGAGVKSYLDNFKIIGSDGTVHTNVEFTSEDLGKTINCATVVELPQDVVKEDTSEVELSDDYAIYQDSSAATTNYDTYFHVYDYSTYGSAEKVVPAGEYKVTLDVYAQSIGTLAYKPIKDWADAGEQLYWTPTEDDLNKWVTVTFAGTTTSEANLHTIIYCQGFKGYVDNITVYTGETELYTLGFAVSDNGKAGHDNNGAGVVGALPKDIADAKAPVVELSDDYAIYQDSSAATTNYDTYFHVYDYSTYGSAEKVVPAGEYKVTLDVYAQSIGTLAYKPIKDWADAGEQLYWTPTEDDLNKWVTVTFAGTTTSEANLHSLIYVQGFKGYVDDITVYTGETELYTLGFTESDNGKAGHDNNGAGVVVALPKDIADAKPIEEPAPTGNYAVLIDNSANTGFGQFYLHEVGMSHDKTYPIGDYTIKFDYYPLANGSSKNIVAHLTATGWSGDAFPGSNGQKWLEVTETLGEWQTISFDITTIAEGQFPWFYIGAGMKGYFDNYQIIDKSTGETVLDFSPVAADLGKTSKDTATVVEFVEPDCVVLVDNSANTGFGQFYLHEVGMSHDATYPIGDYTIKFDYYPIANGSSKNIVAHLTATGWSGDAFPGTNGQKWLEVTETLGEWQTISFDITTIAEGQFPWFYIGAGMKGYFDNYQIIDKSTGETVLDFSPKFADIGKTSKDTATVVEFEEVHIHIAGDVVLENVVDATCEVEGSYDEVVYCTECEEELSRTTVTNDFLLVDTTAVDNGTPNNFWFNTLGMNGYGALENGTYTIQFDVCAIQMPTGGNLFHYRTSSGSGPSSDAGWWKPELTIGEWTTTSNTFTVKDDTTTGNHIFYVYGGFKGYVDNFVILDSNGNEVAGTYTDINGLTVPEQYVAYLTVTNKYDHVAGEAVRENEIEATCTEEGSYDEVVYCTECGEEISRTAMIISVADHTIIFVEKISSTFEINGVKEHYACSVCEKTFSDAEGTLEVNVEELVKNKAGDLNGDDSITGKDYALLLQHINGWTVEIDMDAADIKTDDIINGKDYALLLQYINGWDVVPG